MQRRTAGNLPAGPPATCGLPLYADEIWLTNRDRRGTVKSVTDSELIAILEARFDKIDARFAQIDSRFDQIDTRFEQIDSRFDQIDSRFEQIDSRFEQIDSRFEQIDSRFEQIDSRLDQVEEKVRGLGLQFENIVHGRVITILSEQITHVSEQLERFRFETGSNFGEVNRRLDLIESIRN